MPEPVRFTVYGTPRPQGSTRAFIPKGWKRAIITSDNAKLKPWRQQISATALAQGSDPIPQRIPVRVSLDFFFARPDSATEKKRPGMTVKPDIDKLIRSVFDSLKDILIHDDSQITAVNARKHYGIPERVEIEVEVL